MFYHSEVIRQSGSTIWSFLAADNSWNRRWVHNPYAVAFVWDQWRWPYRTLRSWV